MARILIGGDWFEGVSSEALYESEFEKVVMAQATSLFPGYFLIPFKKTVSSDDGSARADFALIEKNYREWWVIEIELAGHSLSGHVLPQVRTLSNARYTESTAIYLAEKNNEVDSSRLIDMMKGSQPKVLVIVNSDKADWRLPLTAHGAQMMIMELYRSVLNKHAFWIRGGRLAQQADVISSCEFDSVLPRFLVVNSPSALEIEKGQTVQIMFNDIFSSWSRIDIADKVWLSATENNPLPVGEKFELVRMSDGNLQFQIKK